MARVLWVLAVLLLAAPATTYAAPAKRPLLLLFHPGGFVSGDPSLIKDAAPFAKRVGLKPRLVDYLAAGRGIPAQERGAFQLASKLDRSGREVYAYGESAGGLLAARLAQKGLVRAAAVNAPVSSLPAWLRSLGDARYQQGVAEALGVPTLSAQRKFSPSKQRTRQPILALTPAEDPLSPGTVRWARRDLGVQARNIPGGHLETAYATQAMSKAMRWLAKQRTSGS